MADLSNASSQLSVELRSDSAQLARERLIWAIKPFGFLGILLWILSPGTSDIPAEQLTSLTLLAFLLGSGYGLLVYWTRLREYVAFRFEDNARDQKNRLPEEFYVGTIEEVRIEWNR